jgi:hypothetical protein
MKKGYFKNVVNESYVTGQSVGTNKIWVILGGNDYEGRHVMAVYTDKVKAIATYKRLKKQGYGDNEDFYLEQYNANEEMFDLDDALKNESVESLQPEPKQFKVGDVVTLEGDKDGWIIMNIVPGDEGDEYYLMQLGEEGVQTTYEEILAENP